MGEPVLKAVLFCGGGTGGHVYPNVAIAQTLRRELPKARLLYLGTASGAEARIVPSLRQPIPFETIMARGFPLTLRSLGTLWSLIILVLGFVQSLFRIRRFKPDLLVATGGYVSAPVILAAAALRVPIFIHEQNAVPGRLNRLMGRLARRVGVTFPSTLAFFPPQRGVQTGYPVRQDLSLPPDRDLLRQRLNIPPHQKVVFLFGGSGGAKTINHAVVEALPTLLADPRITVILATGRGYGRSYPAYETVQKHLAACGFPVDIPGRLIIREYFNNIEEIYAISDLVVSRAGAGAIKEIQHLGLPAILIPKMDLPGDHQILNALEASQKGGSMVIFEEVRQMPGRREVCVQEEKLAVAIRDLLGQPGRLARMREIQKEEGAQAANAAEIIVRLLMDYSLPAEKPREEETILRIPYLMEEGGEGAHELVFETFSVGTSRLADLPLDADQPVHFVIKSLRQQEEMVLLPRQGEVRVNGIPRDAAGDINEGDRIEAGGYAWTLQYHRETLPAGAQVREERSRTRMFRSSLGIMVSRVGGFVRELVFAPVFGAGKAMDLFAIGLTLSNFARRVVAENAMENAFLPIFSRLFHRSSRRRSWQGAGSIISWTLLLSVLATVTGVLLTPILLPLLFPGLAVRGYLHEGILMTQIMFPFLVLVTLSSIQTTLLKAFNRFGIAEASAILFSLGCVLSVLFFHQRWGVYSLAGGVLLGGLLQVLFLLPLIRRLLRQPGMDFCLHLGLDTRSLPVRRYFSQLTPIFWDVVLAKTSEIVDRVLAISLREGAASFLYFAQTLYRLPFALVSQAINGVMLKDVSDAMARFDHRRIRRLFVDGVRLNVFFLLPIGVLMAFLSRSLVGFLLQRSNFTEAAVAGTAQVLTFYALGLVGWGLHGFSVRLYSARLEIRRSMNLNALMLLLNVGLCLLFSRLWGVNGLALATSFSFTLFGWLRILLLRRRFNREGMEIALRDIFAPVGKSLLATLVMTVILLEGGLLFDRVRLGSPMLDHFVRLVFMGGIGSVVYLLVSLLTKHPDMVALVPWNRSRGEGQKAVPTSMLSPQGFLERVSRDPQSFRTDYAYKVDLYLNSPNWSVRNVGVKLIGLFGLEERHVALMEAYRAEIRNGFIRRNALAALRHLQVWNPPVSLLVTQALNDSYYEVRAEALKILTRQVGADGFDPYRERVHQRIRQGVWEERLAAMAWLAEAGDLQDLPALRPLRWNGSAPLRSALIQIYRRFWQRGLWEAAQVREELDGLLMTSNQMDVSFQVRRDLARLKADLDERGAS